MWLARIAEAQRNEPEEIQNLIDCGMDPSTANGVGQTALHVACLWGTHKCVEVLIKAGAKVRGARERPAGQDARPWACLAGRAPRARAHARARRMAPECDYTPTGGRTEQLQRCHPHALCCARE